MNMMRPQIDDREAAMARADLYKLASYSTKLFKMIQDGDQLEGWVQAKITKAADYVASVYHFMEYEMKFSEYGKRIESADMYSESVKREFKRKLTEARANLDKLKEKNIKDLDEGWEDMMKANKDREKSKGTGKFDVKKTSTGTQYTRKSSTFTDGGDDTDTKKAKQKAKKTEGISDMAKKAGSAIKKAGSKALDKLGHGSDEDLIKDLQKKTGMPQTGKKPMAVKNEALKGGQKKLDVDKDGKLEKSDFAKLRSSKSVKEGSKPDFLDMDKDGNKKEPMKKAVADKKKNPFVKKESVVSELSKNTLKSYSAKAKKDSEEYKKAGHAYDSDPDERDFAPSAFKKAASRAAGAAKADSKIKEASHQEKTTMKHVKNPTAGEKKAAKDIKPGIKGYADRVAMLKSAEKDGRLKEHAIRDASAKKAGAMLDKLRKS